MGGTDHPDNLVELTPAEHAEAHRVLYERHGRQEDYLAWHGLAGYTTKEAIIQEMVTVAAKKGGAARKEEMIKNNPQRDPEIKKRRMETWQNSDHYEDDIERLRSMAGNRKGRKFGPQSAEHRANLSKAKKGKPAWNKGMTKQEMIEYRERND